MARRANRFAKINRIKKRKPFYQNKTLWIFVLAFVLFAALAYLIFFTQLFIVKEVDAQTGNRVDLASIRAAADSVLQKKTFPPSDNFFSIPQEALKKELLGKYSAIKDIKLDKKFPNKLKITVIERNPVGMWCPCEDIPDNTNNVIYSSTSATSSKENLNNFYSYISGKPRGEMNFNCFNIDNEGIIFESATSSELKISARKCEIGMGKQVLDKEVVAKISEIKDKLRGKLNLNVKEAFVFTDSQINFLIEPNWWAYFNPKKDIDWQITSLELVLANKIPPEKRGSLRYIDLRFESISIYPDPADIAKEGAKNEEKK